MSRIFPAVIVLGCLEWSCAAKPPTDAVLVLPSAPPSPTLHADPPAPPNALEPPVATAANSANMASLAPANGTTPSAAPRASAATAAGSSGGFPACGMPSSLVARGWRTELTPTSSVESPPFEAGTTTLVVLPDTQYYASCRSRYFGDQLRWAAEQRTPRNVPVVLTLGDLTDKNTPAEWSYIADHLHAVASELPVVLVTGNHDHAAGGSAGDRSSLFQKFFRGAPGSAQKLLVESLKPGDVENAYYRIHLAHVTLGVLALEWSPRAATVAWANRVLDRYASDRAVVVTHAYLYNDGTRYDWQDKGKLQEWNPLSYGTGKGVPELRAPASPLEPDAAYDGEMLWRDLVARHAGIFLVLSGHVLGGGTGVLSSRGEHGNVVHQVVVNFQMLKDGGLGYLRLLELLPSGKTLRMKTFSPTLGLFSASADEVGTLELEPPLW